MGTRRIMHALLIAVLWVGMLPATAFPQPAIAESVAETKGMEKIHTQADLAAMAEGGSYQLAGDISLSGWESIDFIGELDGDGHAITLDGKPLFKEFAGTIRNMLFDGHVKGTQNMGALAYKMTGGLLQNIWSGAAVEVTGYSANGVGGLVGVMSGGVAQNIVVTGKLTPPPFSPIYGTAVKGEGTTFDHNYWTADAKFVAWKAVEATNSGKLQESTLAELNNEVAHVAGLRYWKNADGVPKPIGAVSIGEITGDVDKTALNEAIASANALQEKKASYTEASWKRFAVVLERATEMADETKITDFMVKKATDDLHRAMNELISLHKYQQLMEKVKEVDELPFDMYSAESYTKAIEVKRKAESLITKLQSETASGMTDSEVDENLQNLLTAIEALEDIRVPIDSAEALAAADGKEYYILTADIAGYAGNEGVLTGKLDGDGHVVTFADGAKPLFDVIEKGGEVQNIGLTGKVSGGGAFAETLKGKVFNSYSWADVDAGDRPAGGIAGEAVSPTVKNTYSTGHITGTVTGGLAGTGEIDFRTMSNYWVNAEKAIGTNETNDKVDSKRTIEQLQDVQFVVMLNKQRIEKYRAPGTKWNRNESGLPYFGEEAATDSDATFHTVRATSYFDDTTEEITNSGETIKVSVFGKPSGDVALLELVDYTGDLKWETVSDEANSPLIVAARSGKVWVRNAGTVLVHAIDAATQKKIQTFTVTAEVPKDYTLALHAEGTDYTDRQFKIQDNKNTHIIPFVKVGDQAAKEVNPDLFEWKSSQPDVVNVSSTGWLNVKKTGGATITAKLGATSKKVEVVAGYKAVESIEPAFKGTYYIHGRNPNSIGQNGTPDVASFSPLRQVGMDGQVQTGSEFHIAKVLPEDATYARSYAVTTSDPSILPYKESMLNALIPMKEGTVDLTVTSQDPELKEKKSGTTQVTIKYFNPLESLNATNKQLTVKTGEVIDAGLVFTGPKSNDGYHVTESHMTWEQTGDGKVAVYRNSPIINVGDEGGSVKEGAVSNDQWLVRGTKAGKVILTGTPVDNGHGAGPISLTVDVTEGDATVDIPAAIKTAKALDAAVAKQLETVENPVFGSEWSVLGLARSGRAVPQVFYDAYYASVIDQVRLEGKKSERRWDNKVTEVQRLALALTAIGKDPREIETDDLLDYTWNKAKHFPGISNGGLGDRQGSNELIFGLLTVEAHPDFEQPANAAITADGMIDKLLADYQLPGGGFGLYDNKTFSIDMTAMALQALAKHYDRSDKVKQSVDDALDVLSRQQGVDGSYGTSEATSQVLVALAELGIDPAADERFIQNGQSLLDGQLGYQLTNGAFSHTIGGKHDGMATDQALYALAAADRLYQAKNSLYRMSDIKWENETSENTAVRGVTVTPAEKEVPAGKTISLHATVLPANATNQSVVWQSSNPSIATVDAQGTVTALAPGEAVITVTTVEGGHTATANITITAKLLTPETKRTIQFSIEKRTLGKGDIMAPASVAIEKGDTAFTVLKRAVDAKGISIRYIGNGATLYVSAIDNLGEFDEGTGSGWMYSVNGVFPEYSAGLYALKEGDVLRWRYTKDLGIDLGEQPPKPVTPKPETPPVVGKPNHVEVTVKEGVAKIEVKDEKTGNSKPAKIEKSESIGGFTIVQIGEQGNVMLDGLKLPEGKQKVVVIDNDRPYEYFKSESDQLPDKEWKITFSGALLDDTDNLKKISVKNAAGETIDIKPILSADGKTLTIDPLTDYERGELYYMTIADMKSADGKALKNPIRKVFTVK